MGEIEEYIREVIMKKKIRKTDQKSRIEALIKELHLKLDTFNKDLLHIEKTLDGTLKRLRDIRKMCREMNYTVKTCNLKIYQDDKRKE